MEGAVPHPEIAPLLAEHFVALASDCDEPEPRVIELARNLPDAYMLPFVVFADAEGNFVTGSSGQVHPSSFKRTLEELAGAS